MFALRQYQRQACDMAAQSKRALIVAPPGAGKTTIAAELIRRELEKPRASAQAPRRFVLVLAHRKELIAQAAARISGHGVGTPSVIMAGHAPTLGSRVLVASVQTLARRKHTIDAFAGSISLVIVDEAHRAMAKSYKKIFERLPTSASVIGLTASPYRLDGQPLGDLFDDLIIAAQPDELIQAGHLIEPKIYGAPVALGSVKRTRGDFDRGTLSAAMNVRRLTGRIVEHYLKLAKGRRAVVFACSVEHSEQIAGEMRAAGVRAAHIDAQTPGAVRDQVLADLRGGALSVVSNVEILTEGWDLPELGAVICARPTMSAGLYTQMVGRVLRPKPGGAGGIIIDHAGLVSLHGWPTARRVYSLDQKEQRPKKVPDLRLPGFSNCARCFALFARKNKTACPECGEPLPRSELRRPPIETAEALIEYQSELEAKRREKAAANADKLYIKDLKTARDRQYRDGWADFRYKSRRGRWPTNEQRENAKRAIDHE